MNKILKLAAAVVAAVTFTGLVAGPAAAWETIHNYTEDRTCTTVERRVVEEIIGDNGETVETRYGGWFHVSTVGGCEQPRPDRQNEIDVYLASYAHTRADLADANATISEQETALDRAALRIERRDARIGRLHDRIAALREIIRNGR